MEILEVHLLLLHLFCQLTLGGLCGSGGIDGLLEFVGMIHKLGCKFLLMLLLQFLCPLHDKALNFFVLVVDLGSQYFLTSGKIFFS